MKNDLDYKAAVVYPNGVDFEKVYPMNKVECQKHLGWDTSKKHFLFAASPLRPEKNYVLAKSAFDKLENDNYELHYLEYIPDSEMLYYYNSSDVILLTSKYEGSPNVIKEAMACNCPIVSVDVGDVKKVIGKTSGCFICSYEPKNVAEKINKALNFGKKTNGRQRIIEMGLDADTVSKKIKKVYEIIIKKSK